jgi:hypothetical protein
LDRVYVDQKQQVVAAPDPDEDRDPRIKPVPACKIDGQPLIPRYAHMSADRSGALCTSHYAEDFAVANDGLTPEPTAYEDAEGEPLPDNILRPLE